MKIHLLLLYVLTLCASCISQEIGKEAFDQGIFPKENNTQREWKNGWLEVKENRSESNSNIIKLPYVLSITPDSLKEGNCPVLIMSGGPGNSSLHMANGSVYNDWALTRDLLVLEQRGTRYSQPSLFCPEIDSMRVQGMSDGLYGSQLDSVIMLGMQSCYDRLTDESVDLNGYNTLESVEDIEQLRKSLKIDQLILYGMSYSCNLMDAYAHSYPQRVKAMILDSPLPHEVHYDEEAFQNIDSVFIKVIEHYTGSNDLYFNWTKYIEAIGDSVFTVSIDSITYNYTKDKLIDIPLFHMSAHGTLPQASKSIEQIVNGDHKEIKNIIKYYLEPSWQALGMRFSVWIAEELSEEDENRYDKLRRRHTWLEGYHVNDVSFESAEFWPVNSLYKDKVWPSLNYEGPTLILSGEFDPWTPIHYGKKMKERLSQAEHLIYPEMTHLPGFREEGMRDITDFLNSIHQ